MRQEAGINNAMIIALLLCHLHRYPPQSAGRAKGEVKYNYVARLSLNLTLPTHAGQ